MTEPAAAIDPHHLAWVRLAMAPGIGPRLQDVLIERFGSPEAVLSASISQLEQTSGIGPKLAMGLVTHTREAEALAEIELCRAAQVQLLTKVDSAYPGNLARAAGAPGLLYVKGKVVPADEIAIAIVGTRHPTSYGEQQAAKLAGGLARAGVTVVSGLARGIDAAAHQAALDAGGRTIAVTGHGLSLIYPPEHRDLASEITKSGAIVSEYNFRQSPLPGLFPQRNRIISGLSLGVIVIEAGRGSGALHTARHAVEQNREVFALPGRVDHESSAGCLDLIRDGATLIRGVDDVLSTLGPLAAPVIRSESEVVIQPRELQLNEQEKLVLNAVGSEPTSVDEILRSVAIEEPRVLSTITILEMKRIVRRLPGNMLIRCT